MISQYSGEGANSEKKYFQMRFFTFCHQINIVSIDNRCQYRLLSENNSPPPPRLFHFAPLSRVATSRWARAIVFYHLWS